MKRRINPTADVPYGSMAERVIETAGKTLRITWIRLDS
jgi:hypothetical protein